MPEDRAVSSRPEFLDHVMFPFRFHRRACRRVPTKSRSGRRCVPRVEILEDRTLPSGFVDLAVSSGIAHVSDFLAASADYRVYQLSGLQANDIVTVTVDAQQIGSGLNS